MLLRGVKTNKTFVKHRRSKSRYVIGYILLMVITLHRVTPRCPPKAWSGLDWRNLRGDVGKGPCRNVFDLVSFAPRRFSSAVPLNEHSRPNVQPSAARADVRTTNPYTPPPPPQRRECEASPPPGKRKQKRLPVATRVSPRLQIAASSKTESCLHVPERTFVTPLCNFRGRCPAQCDFTIPIGTDINVCIFRFTKSCMQ